MLLASCSFAAAAHWCPTHLVHHPLPLHGALSREQRRHHVNAHVPAIPVDVCDGHLVCLQGFPYLLLHAVDDSRGYLACLAARSICDLWCCIIAAVNDYPLPPDCWACGCAWEGPWSNSCKAPAAAWWPDND